MKGTMGATPSNDPGIDTNAGKMPALPAVALRARDD